MQCNVLGHPDSSAKYFSQADNPINQGLAAGQFWYKPIELLCPDNPRSSIIKTQLVIQDTENPFFPVPTKSSLKDKCYVIKRYPSHEKFITECSIIKFLNDAEEINTYVISLLAIFTIQGTQSKPNASLYPLYNGDLVNLLEQEPNGLSLRRTTHFSWQLLDILCFLKKNHVVHRDIKLDNIFLKNKERGEIILGDFEFACIDDVEESDLSPELRASKKSLGNTLPYASPESLLGRLDLLTYSSDIWSTACSIISIYTSRLLFDGSSKHSVIRSHEIRLGKSYLQAFNTKPYFDSRPKCPELTLKRLLFIFCHRKQEKEAELDALYKLLNEMLMLHPSDRISAENALAALSSFSSREEPQEDTLPTEKTTLT